MEELRQVDVGDREARRRVVGRAAEVLADVGVEGLVVDDLELQVDAGLLELACTICTVFSIDGSVVWTDFDREPCR